MIRMANFRGQGAANVGEENPGVEANMVVWGRKRLAPDENTESSKIGFVGALSTGSHGDVLFATFFGWGFPAGGVVEKVENKY